MTGDVAGREDNRSIALVGFMGAGKTTVGRELARRMGMEFVDTDRVVETWAGCPVSMIFATEGQSRFREMESRAVADSCARPACVIAVGGGALGCPATRTALREACTVVFLAASVEAILQRTGAEDGRPLLDGLSPSERRYVVEDLLYDRTPLYQETRHLIVDANLPVPAIVDAILARLGLR